MKYAFPFTGAGASAVQRARSIVLIEIHTLIESLGIWLSREDRPLTAEEQARYIALSAAIQFGTARPPAAS